MTLQANKGVMIMNKIKLMYDVVKTMKEKDVFQGALKVEGKKDEVQFVSFENEFRRNVITGEVAAKISSQLDVKGKKIKHESNTEFTLDNSFGHFHSHQAFHPEHSHAANCHSFKHKLTALAYVLNLIDNMQILEQEDKLLVKLNLNELPEDFRKAIAEKMQHGYGSEQHEHSFPIQRFLTMKETVIDLAVLISKTKEVEEITFTVNGVQNDELNETHAMNLQGELRFVW